MTRGGLERQDRPAPSGSRDLQERKDKPGRRVTREQRFPGHQGQRGPRDLRGFKVFLDQREKQDWTEQKERRASRERKETGGLWDCLAVQDQLEFQARRDQRARGAAKETPG